MRDFMGKTELYIYNFLKSLSIYCPDQLNIENISRKSKIEVQYWDCSSESVHYKGHKIILLNNNLTYQQQWQEFGHELCHVLWHAGRQENISDSFCSYQEGQADNFAYHLCIPTFMLCRLKGVSTYEVMNLFNVEYGFASKRLEMYRNKIIMKGVTTKCQKDMYGIVAETGGNWK